MSSGFLNTETINEPTEIGMGSIPSDRRDFSRPRESYYAEDIAQDMQLASDDNYLLGEIWDTIKQKVQEVKDWISPEEEEKEENKSKFEKSLDALEEEKKKISPKTEQEPEEKLPQDQIITQWQQYFKKSHPIIGTPYAGPVDGKVNLQLATAAKNAENLLAAAINKLDKLDRGSSVTGKLWNPTDKNFSTSISDLENAIQLILKYQKYYTEQNSKKAQLLSILEKI